MVQSETKREEKAAGDDGTLTAGEEGVTFSDVGEMCDNCKISLV